MIEPSRDTIKQAKLTKLAELAYLYAEIAALQGEITYKLCIAQNTAEEAMGQMRPVSHAVDKFLVNLKSDLKDHIQISHENEKVIEFTVIKISLVKDVLKYEQ